MRASSSLSTMPVELLGVPNVTFWTVAEVLQTLAMVSQQQQLTRVHLARLAAGIQQQQLASSAGISPGRLSACERGHDELSVQHRVRLCELLGYPVSVLFPIGGHAIEPAAVRRWLLSNNDEGPAGQPAPVGTMPGRGTMDGSSGHNGVTPDREELLAFLTEAADDGPEAVAAATRALHAIPGATRVLGGDSLLADIAALADVADPAADAGMPDTTT